MIDLKVGLIPTVRAGSGLTGQKAGLAAGTLCDSALAKAKQYRKSAAGQLAIICAPISKSLDIYTSKIGGRSEREPNGLLRPDQIKSDAEGIKALQQQFQAAGQAAGLTASDVKVADISLKKLGGDAATIGGSYPT
ncbi:MAG: hypothetical protein ACRDP6_35145 [Actinoallomurus sp.]